MTVGLWSFPSGKLIRTLRGHLGPVISVAFCPKGENLATASCD